MTDAQKEIFNLASMLDSLEHSCEETRQILLSREIHSLPEEWPEMRHDVRNHARAIVDFCNYLLAFSAATR